ncbi:MAG: hypothetical protein GEU78_07690 [Actinobacteria bacterium]|nr:hypothetical protein [Actinomycetota bacterium]MQB00160.1 hypothetical protein [Actinomycetota bacterium]
MPRAGGTDAGGNAMNGRYRDLSISQHGGVLVVELDRPEKRNAMRLGLREELIQLFTEIDADSQVRAAVVTGAGRAFSAGADLDELRTRTVESELSPAGELRRRLSHVIETSAKPVVAAVNGPCIGAGLELALACHIRVASTKATFGLPEVSIGVVPGSGGTQRLTRVVGVGWSMHMTLTGVPISAEQAYQIGLVTGLHQPDLLREEAIALAELLGKQPPMAYRCARDAVTRAYDVDLATGIELERKLFALCLSTGVPTRKAQELLDRISTSTAPGAAES